jgi:exopolyphosphatase/guanosine-5'-triphosphate,3'-diphosphate pyrophosphatase
MNTAVIDIGSNTTRLLVAEKKGDGLRELLSHRAYTRLGRGLAKDPKISKAKIETLIETLQVQGELAAVLGAGNVHAIATAALRSAENGEAVIEQVRQRTGLAVELLGDEEEARLAFLGATHALPFERGQKLAVIDVGGGSTEVAVGTVERGVAWSRSFQLGSGMVPGRLTGDVFAEQDFPAVDLAIAIGGTASSLRRIVGNVLEQEAMERATRLIGEYSADQVAEEFGLDIERVEVLPAGLMILEAAAERFGRPLRIGKGGLREGKLLELLA